MKKFNWAVNPLKLERAIAKAGVDASEEAIKALYVSWGGLLAKGYENDTTNSTEDSEPVEEKGSDVGGSERTRVSRSK